MNINHLNKTNPCDIKIVLYAIIALKSKLCSQFCLPLYLSSLNILLNASKFLDNWIFIIPRVLLWSWTLTVVIGVFPQTLPLIPMKRNLKQLPFEKIIVVSFQYQS